MDDALFSADNWASKSLTGFITITNTGRVAAKDVNATLDLNPPRAENVYDVARFPELAPGSSYTTRIVVRMERSKSTTELSDTKEYVLSMKVEYTDGVDLANRATKHRFVCPWKRQKLRARSVYIHVTRILPKTASNKN